MIVKSKTSQQNSLWGNLFVSSLATFGLVLLLASSANAARFAAPPTGTRVDLDEQKLLTLLGSNAPDAEKAVACKKLAICGTKKSVPALAPLLADERFSSWARIALEAIPGSAADQALREAMGKLEGRLLVGIINSIGYRRDAKAVSALTKRLSDPNAEVASAAAVALGRIGDSKCAKALTRALATAPTGVQSAVATGCILCAERAMAEKKSRDAIKLYETVRTANVPTQRVLEATRGAILARGTAGIPLLLEQLRSPDRALFGVGLRTARELPGAEATKAIVEELQRCSPERQPLLLLALADRNDAAALSAIVDAATGGRQQTRLVAVRVLDRMGKSSSIPVLVKIASEDNPELGEAAMSALARLGGANIDADLLARLAQASGPTRGALIQVAVRRGMANALPVILSSSADPNPKSRLATIQAIGALGQKENINDLLKLLQNAKEAKERSEVEAALVAISSRSGPACVGQLLPLAKSGDPEARIMALHALSAAGGSEALAGIASAAGTEDQTVQDEAVRTLSTWPNNWPEDEGAAEPLLTLVRAGTKTSQQVLGLRGYLNYIHGSKKLNPQDKTAKLAQLVPYLKRPEEKRLVIGAAEKLETAGSFELLTELVADTTVSEEAGSAILKLAEAKPAPPLKSAREKALQTVIETSQNAETKAKATKLLNTNE